MFSFATRTEQNDVQRLIRRIMDASAFSQIHTEGESRVESRSNGTMSIVLTPCEQGSALLDKSVFAITKDWSSRGLSVITKDRQNSDSVVLGFLIESRPYLLLGKVRTTIPIGGGFWQLGIELMELLRLESSPGLSELLPLLWQLDANQSRV